MSSTPIDKSLICVFCNENYAAQRCDTCDQQQCDFCIMDAEPDAINKCCKQFCNGIVIEIETAEVDLDTSMSSNTSVDVFESTGSTRPTISTSNLATDGTSTVASPKPGSYRFRGDTSARKVKKKQRRRRSLSAEPILRDEGSNRGRGRPSGGANSMKTMATTGDSFDLMLLSKKEQVEKCLELIRLSMKRQGDLVFMIIGNDLNLNGMYRFKNCSFDPNTVAIDMY